MNNAVKVLFGSEARSLLKKGIDIVADAVKVTLGWGGRTVVISKAGFAARATKDGVTVASSIFLQDEGLNAGAKIMIEASSKVAEEAGDGTTTVCVLTQKLVNGAITLHESNVNPVKVKKGMQIACDAVVEQIAENALPADERLLNCVAQVSSNNDPEIGKLIGDAYNKMGKHGNIVIERSVDSRTWIDIVDGYQFLCGYITPLFINNYAKNTCELNNPYVLVMQGKMGEIGSVRNVIEKVAQSGKDLLIIAEDFDVSVVSTLLANKENFKSCLIKYDFTGETKEEIMHDLCAITGATLAESKGNIINNLNLSYLGTCEKIVVSKKDTVVVRGNSDKEKLEARIKDAQVKIENEKSPIVRQRHEARLAKLSGSIAVCYVGGSTDIEVEEKKDRIDDAVRATKAAMEEGVLPGGGIALVRIKKRLNERVFNVDDDEIKAGIQLVLDSLTEPFNQIIKNCGENHSSILKELNMDPFWNGYNAQSDSIGDMLKSGIVDPAKVTRVCIQTAVSTAIQVLISESLIISEK